MEFRFDTFLVGLVIFSFIIAAGSGWITDMATHYDVEYEEQFGASYNVVEELENLTVDQKGKVVGGELSETDILDSSIKGATGALNLMTSPIQIVTLISGKIREKIKPAIDFTMYIKLVLTTFIIFGLIYLFFRIRSW